jgi:outer membrane receptor protein involved in Fe transport
LHQFLPATLILWFALIVLAARAQETGTIVGVVVSTWDGAPLANVAVTVRGTTLATQTESNGRYELKNVPPGDQVLRFSKSGYAAAVVTDARVLPGQTTTVNGNLRPEFYEMEEYEVTAEEFTEQTEKILIERQRSSVMVEALGSEFLSRVGAGNAAESISKVAGATIVDGKSAVVRGLNDRYITTTLNGASIPSADPYRQSAALDLFPAQVIDRVVVAKTFTPDQPGTFTGGGIDIVTKSFPEKPFFSFSLGAAYNTQASLNDRFLSYKGGDLDWAAMDDGSRELPGVISSQAPIHPPPPGAMPDRIVGNVTSNNWEGQFLVDKVTKELGLTQFAPERETSPVNHNFSAAGGGSVPIFDGRFGYFAGGSYKHEYWFYEHGISRRYEQGTQLKNSYDDTRALDLVNWSGMVNLAYEPVPNHELGFTFFYNQNGTDDARIQDQGFEQTDTSATFRKFNLYYIERNLNTYQMKGDHHFPFLADLEFNWLVALTETTQDEPDARFFNDFSRGAGFMTGNPAPSPSDPTRYFRHLDENNENVKLDWRLPFHNWTDLEGAVKFGLFDSDSDRSFTDRAFYYKGGPTYGNDPNKFLNLATLGANPTTNAAGRINFHWQTYSQVFDSLYDAKRDVQAAYLMLDVPVFKKLRFIGGARYETTDLRVHSESYAPSSVTGQFINDAKIDQTDLLPSVGVVFSVTSNMNVRVSYSQTIARPSFRELAAYYAYDPVIDEFVEGNPRLQMTAIDNYDLRWDWFPRPGELFSVSLFYKDLKNAIERGDLRKEGDVITYLNRDEAELYGVEFEARKSLDFVGPEPFFGCLTLEGNLSLVESDVKLTPNELSTKRQFFPHISSSRPLYDQSPYIVNLDLTFNDPRIGTTVSIIANLVGPRIVLTKLNTEDVYEQPAPTVDLLWSQRIGRHATLRFSVKNLLDPKLERTYGKDGDLLYSSYRKGRTLGVTMNYDF